ncbi:MAG: FHA domain-containing protein [Gammaproteobacteria bacterium]|nr:FHA domain-containing protein [Gammaproteobacteria bacterium]
MYYEFFNLKEHPFRLTCEPKYFYLSPEHTHANAMMEFALIKRQGIMLLTGEVGTGKTMLVQHFLSRLDTGYKIISINQTKLSELEFLQLLLLEMDEQVTQDDQKQQLVASVIAKLEQLHHDNLHTIIFIDEAQNLEPEILKLLFQLSQVRVDNQRVCTIYLVGQNKIRETLEQPEVSEAVSIINAKYHLGPLNLKDIRRYIYHRLAVAGSHKSVKFDKEVFPVIETYTGGRPRLINVLTDHVLTYAFMEESKEVSTRTVDKAVEDLQWLPFGVQYGGEQARSPDVFKEERRNSYKLVIRINNKVQGEYFIRKKRINIGRHRDNDLRIDDPLISRQHAQILQQGRTIYLRDLNSTNGTYVNNKRVDIAALEEGTVVKLGNCLLTFLRNNKPQSSGESSSNRNVLDFAATQH